MEWVTANLHVQPKTNPTGYSWRLYGFATVPQFGVSQSHVVCLFTGTNCAKQQQKSLDCMIYTGHSSTERTSGDVCPKTYPWCWMTQMLKIRSWCMVSIAIPNAVMVKTQILFCSSSSNIPTLTYKMQFASMWSISCNIWHLAHQQSRHMIQWSMLRKWTFPHSRLAHMANRHFDPHDDIIKRMRARAAWKQRSSEPWERCTAYDQKWCSQRWIDDKLSF